MKYKVICDKLTKGYPVGTTCSLRTAHYFLPGIKNTINKCSKDKKTCCAFCEDVVTCPNVCHRQVIIELSDFDG